MNKILGPGHDPKLTRRGKSLTSTGVWYTHRNNAYTRLDACEMTSRIASHPFCSLDPPLRLSLSLTLSCHHQGGGVCGPRWTQDRHCFGP